MPSELGCDVDNIAQKLYGYIKHGDLRNVQETLDPITDRAVIRAIEDSFICLHTDTDPVNFAITKKEEKIAIYLVEKAFCTDRVYQWPDQSCDQWCYYEHGPDKCKAEFTAVDHSEQENLYKLTKRIKEISQGQRNPGDGLVISTVQHHMVGQQPMEESKSPKYERPVPAHETKGRKTAADEAREILQKYRRKYVDKDGNTLLHLNIRKPQVYTYVFANGGVPVNIQNKKGDSALHLAVREGLYDTVEALVQCSANISLRNFMGQTPIDVAEGPIRTMMEKFKPGFLGVVLRGKTRPLEQFKKFWCSTEVFPIKPGVVEAVCSGKSQLFDRILRILTWASLDSKVKEEKNLLELAMLRAEEDPQVENCVRILKTYRTSSRLIHAVLCENVELARDIIETEKGWNANIRFMDRTGKTLLSHAIEANNIDLVRLLVDRGWAKVNGVRVRENGMVEQTVPLFHKCLKAGLNPEIAKFLNARMDAKERLEKDKNGNTAVLRAIEEEVSPKLIHWLIDTSGGSCLVERNKDGLTPRELALAQKSDAIVKVIDRYISQKPTHIPKCAEYLCHERDTLDVVDETTGKTLSEIVQEEKHIKLKFQKFEVDAEKLSCAAAKGDLAELDLYTTNYVDRNGYTALTRAIVFHQYKICKHLCTTRPQLKSIPDNMNRYPLHYAYALPADIFMDYVCLLLERNPESIEHKLDMMGRCAAEYKDLRQTVEIQTMLYDAMILDVLGKGNLDLIKKYSVSLCDILRIDVNLDMAKIYMAGVIDEAEDAYSSGTPDQILKINMMDSKENERMSVLLSKYLELNYTGTQEELDITRKSCSLKGYFDSSEQISVCYVGSFAEGLYLPGSDLDVMLACNNVIAMSSDQCIPPRLAHKTILYTQAADCRPGYVYLQPHQIQAMDMPLLTKALVKIEDSMFVSSDMFREHLVVLASKETRVKLESNGPACSVHMSDLDRDVVPCFSCHGWPEGANEWITRPRLYGWPNRTMIDHIVHRGCHLVPLFSSGEFHLQQQRNI